MTDEPLRERGASAAQASAQIWDRVRRLTSEAFAAAEQQRLTEEVRANARKREPEPTHGRPRVTAT
jgi:hypothetical protein